MNRLPMFARLASVLFYVEYAAPFLLKTSFKQSLTDLELSKIVRSSVSLIINYKLFTLYVVCTVINILMYLFILTDLLLFTLPTNIFYYSAVMLFSE